MGINTSQTNICFCATYKEFNIFEEEGLRGSPSQKIQLLPLFYSGAIRIINEDFQILTREF